MSKVVRLANFRDRVLSAMFPGHFDGAKHQHYSDFGYPAEVDFKLAFDMYERNGIARAGIDKTVGKTWQDAPFLLEKQRDGSQGKATKETRREREIRQRFSDLRLWQHLAECDRRGMVGAYAGLILRFADSKRFIDPVDTVPGGLDGLVEVIPAWEGQLTVSEWFTDETAEDYGQPKLFQFSEAGVGSPKNARQFQIHPDRVLVWSRDGTVNGRSVLKAGFNSLLDMEKIRGAGGEGFWKNAKSAPVLEVDKDASVQAMANAMGIQESEVADRMNEQVEDWQKGFDKLLMLQGMKATLPQVTLPSPEHFFAIALQEFAASMSIPLKILVGSQTGERASTEDASEWSQTIMSRRDDQAIPNVMTLVGRLERVGVLPERDWFLDWSDLTEASMGEKIERAAKMATVNQTMKDSGELVFTPEELREVVDMEPLSDAEKYLEDPPTEDEAGALPPDPTKPLPAA